MLKNRGNMKIQYIITLRFETTAVQQGPGLITGLSNSEGEGP